MGSEKAAEMLQNLTLESLKKSVDAPEPAKKTSIYQYGITGSDVSLNGQTQTSDRSMTPFLSDSMDPALCYLPGGYGYYYGSYNGAEWDDYSRYMKADEVETTPGLYVYAAYGSYSPATLGSDAQIYGTHNYQYPPYFQPSPIGESFRPGKAKTAQSELSTNTATDHKSLPLESGRRNSTTTLSNGVMKEKNSLSKPFNPANDTHGRANVGSGYQDSKFGFNEKNKNAISIPSKNSTVSEKVTSKSFYPGGMGSPYGFADRMNSGKFHSQYGNDFGLGMAFESGGYDPRMNSWFGFDNKFGNRGKGNGSISYRNEKTDGRNELIKGPRVKVLKGQNVQSGEENTIEKETTPSVPSLELYNKPDFPEKYSDAKFFVIKSYSEDDVHKSVKYNVWASTPNGNKKLNAAYQEAQNSGGCPIFLFFSVNTSGQFVGLAEMAGLVDFDKNLEYWQQDKWSGCFSVKWHIIKDVPNSLLKHIILENNENKPVTNSRDTQEVKLEQGLQMIKIFKEHSSKTCLLDDFVFYERRERILQEKKAKQKQFQKQASEEKANDEKKETASIPSVPPEVVSFTVTEPDSIVQNGDFGHHSENESVPQTVGTS